MFGTNNMARTQINDFEKENAEENGLNDEILNEPELNDNEVHRRKILVEL